MKDYDQNQESLFIIPEDANNLYGKGMSFKLPYRNFKWCSEEELEYLKNHLVEIPDDNDEGYSLECDIKYPKELHDKHNDFPFFPEHRIITQDTLSRYQKRLMNNNLGSVYRTPKLIADLYDKYKTVVDYRTLK
jgi:hypothetical protein